MHVLRRKSGVKKRIVSLFMALVMTLTLLPAAWAAELTAPQEDTVPTEEQSAQEVPAAAAEVMPATEAMPAAEQDAEAELTEANSFLLFAATNVEVLIAPERVPYQPGQTVREALLALQNREETPHTFTGLETANGFVTAIDGVSANYNRSDDKGGYKLDQSASAVGAFVFLTAYDMLNEDTASALYALGRAMLAWQEAEKPQMQKFAQQEYDDAAKALTVKKTADELTALATALTERMEAYTQYENAETKPLDVRLLGLDGQLLTDYTFTATDPYGNEKTFTNEHPALAAGSYTFTLTSGLNGASGAMTVAEDGSVTVADETLTVLRVPQNVEWIAQPVLRSVNGGDAAENRYPMEQNGTMALVPDTVGPTGGLYLYGVPGADLDDSKDHLWNGNRVALYAVYTDVNGKEIDKSRSWESTYQALTNLLTAGTQGSDLRLEARADMDGYTLYQAWELTLERTPTLYGLSVTAGGVDQKLDFSGTTTEYACVVTTGSVVLRPARNSSYTVTVNGSPLDADGTYTLPLVENSATTATIAVTMPESGRTTNYTLTVTREAAVPLTVKHDNDVTVRIFNAAGAEIGVDADGTYPLTPGDSSYTYIATKNEYYHTKGTFKAPAKGAESLTIAAVTPETDDYLTSLKLAASAVGTSSVYLPEEQFRAGTHVYASQMDDRNNSVYVWAAAAQDKNCKIRVPRTDGKETIVPSGMIAYGTFASSLAEMGPEAFRFTLLVSREDSEKKVIFEQDYLVDFARVLTLADMSLSVDGMETLYYPVIKGEVADYDGFYWKQYDYQATVLGSAQEAVLTVTPFAGYSVQVNGGQVYAPEVDPETGETAETVTITLPLDETKKQESFTLTACTEEGHQARAYTLTLKKGAPIDTTVTIQDKSTKQTIAGALAAVYEMRSGSRVWPNDDGTFSLVEGLTYTCVATCSGYVGDTQEIAAGKAEEIVISLAAAPASSHGAGVTSRWPSFRGNNESNGVVDVKTPTSSKDAVLSWANKLGDGYSTSALGCPILIEEGGVEFLIVYSGRKLYKVESVTGTVVATGTMYDTSSFAITSATYGSDCGMLFVALSNGTVQAFDAATLDSLWIYQDALGGQPNCPLTYHDGYVYTGFWNDEKANANFVCLSATDEDPTSDSEKKLARWTYTRQGGFYWAGAYVCDDYLLVGADDGQDQYSSANGALLCLDPSTGEELDRWDNLRGDVRSSIALDKSTGLFYFTSKGGYLYRAAVTQTADGWRITDTRSCVLSNGSNKPDEPAMSTCTPVLYHGRAYIGVSGTSQFGAYTGHNITVVDLDSMSVLYSVPTKGYPQTSGLLTTAYEYPSVYFFDNFSPGTLRLLEDTGADTLKRTTETYQVSGVTYEAETAYALFTPANEQAQYAICSPIADSKGTVFFKNDSAYLMALTSDVDTIKVKTLPDKMSYNEGEKFNPAGMVLTVYYKNGESRDLPVSRTINNVEVTYFTYNSDTLTAADDGYFELTYVPVMYQSGADGEPVIRAAKTDIPISVTGRTYDRGDINGDGAVDVYDLQYLYEYCCDNDTITNPSILDRVDVNGDGLKNISDAAALYEFLTRGSWPMSDTSSASVQTTAASGGGTAKLLGSASSAGAIDRAALKSVAASQSSAPARAAVKGDINGDGAVDVYDLQYLYEYCCDKSTITDAATLARLDVNGDGKQDIADAAALYGYLTEGQWPAPRHAIAVKADAPTKAEVTQGGQYTLYMSEVFDTCSHNVTYTLSGEGLGKHTKLASDDKGDYLSFTNGETGEYSLTITAVCGADSAVQADYHLTVTVTKSAAGDPGQYGYDETPARSVTVYVTVSNDGVPIRGVDGTPISHLQVKVPYFDLESQGLEDYYRYHTENGQGGYIDGEIVERPTLLHLYLYLLGVYCLGYTPDDVIDGNVQVRDAELPRDLKISGIGNILDETTVNWTGPALTISGSATSMYMTKFWGHDENLMYYRNHMYPLMRAGWGCTADYILLSDGDTIDVALFSDWNFWTRGAFACFDADEYTVKTGETLNFNTRKYETKSVADGGSESFQPIEGMKVYLCNEQWTRLAVIEPTESGDAYQYVIDQPGEYYLLAIDPYAGTNDACLAPATARVHVTAAG